MIFQRQKHLLALVSSFGNGISALDFQKLLFLFCQENEGSFYEFVPYKFGGFSFTSYADKRRLIEQGYLEDIENFWKLTSIGEKEANIAPQILVTMNHFAQRYSGIRGDKLIAEAYRLYPYYAIHSEVANRVLAGDNIALKAISNARPSKAIPGICTIGYEERSLEGYLNCLIQNGVTLLCDVRRNPLSRKYGFSKKTLSKSCAGVGIQYEHLPELGIASEYRQCLETQEDYDALFLTYEQQSLPLQNDTLNLIRGWVEKNHRVALTCFERFPQKCHRHSVAEALERDFGDKFTPIHL